MYATFRISGKCRYNYMEEPSPYRELSETLFFKTNPIPTFILRREDFSILMANEQASKVYGLAPGKFGWKSLTDFCKSDICEESVVEAMAKVVADLGDILKGGTASHLCKHKLGNGDVIDVNILFNSFTHGEEQLLLATCLNISKYIETENEITKVNRINALLGGTSKLIAQNWEKGAMIDEVVKMCVNIGEFDITWYGELSDDGEDLVIKSCAGRVANQIVGSIHPYKEYLKEKVPSAVCLDTSKSIVINNLHKANIYVIANELLQSEGINSLAYVPITPFGKRYGVMGFFSKRPIITNIIDLENLEELGTDMSSAMEKIQTNEELDHIYNKLRESEIKYSTYFNEDISAGFMTSLDGSIIDCNKQFINIFKLRDYKHAISTNLADFYQGHFSRKKLVDTLEKEGKMEALEVEYVKTDGTPLHALMNIVGVFDEEGKLTGTQGHIFDITKIKEAEREMVKARGLAEQSNLLKDQFLANISHEIRTPMNAIVGFNGIIRESLSETANEEVMEIFDIIEDASNRLMRTIDLIITMSKLRSGNFYYHPKEIDIDNLINDLINNITPITKGKDVPIAYSNKSGVKRVWGDETCFSQIFMNIIDNAVKFTHKGSVSVECGKQGNGDLLISVVDTGIGMTEEFKNELFAPFYQENYSLSRKHEGLGLGLSVVKHFIELAGYSIGVESRKGIGSRFTVTIPKENYLRSF